MATKLSKTRLLFMWIKWFASGAVKQPSFPKGSLFINYAHAYYEGPLEGKTHLVLGGELKEGAFKSLCEVVVPTGFGYDAGTVLDRIPGNAVPASLYPGLSLGAAEEFLKEQEPAHVEPQIRSTHAARVKQFMEGTGDW